jgi:hypothetical protein
MMNSQYSIDLNPVISFYKTAFNNMHFEQNIPFVVPSPPAAAVPDAGFAIAKVYKVFDSD